MQLALEVLREVLIVYMANLAVEMLGEGLLLLQGRIPLSQAVIINQLLQGHFLLVLCQALSLDLLAEGWGQLLQLLV